jgi:2-methylaconitate cis-trans-isomerase PrpF
VNKGEIAMQIPCILMRGGTSRGPFFLTRDLPADPEARDAALIAVMGSGHPLQIDGIGGGNPLTSKVAIVGPATREGADVDYLFAQVLVEQKRVDTGPNCGNMLTAVGPYAIETGLVPAADPVTRVVIHNVNTGKLIEALVETPGGQVTYDGTAQIAGVPGTAAPVRVAFLDAAGSKTGQLFPTGQRAELIDGVEVTLIDMSVPAMIVAASSLGLTGGETPAELDGNTALLARLERLRQQAGRRMGLGDVAGSVIPKPILLSAPAAGGTIRARYFMPHRCHTAVAITGAVCIATACSVAGTVAHRLADLPPLTDGSRALTIEHPAGTTATELEQDPETGEVTRVSLVRTARLLFDGRVHITGTAA